MKKRCTSGWVTVTGPPAAICSRKSGTTEPAESSTLPNRTTEKRVAELSSIFWITSSPSRLVAPMTLVGRTALSVDMKTKRATPMLSATRARLCVPSTFVFTASPGALSISGTCLRAAAWKTSLGR